jgi:hypothetical protein
MKPLGFHDWPGCSMQVKCWIPVHLSAALVVFILFLHCPSLRYSSYLPRGDDLGRPGQFPWSGQLWRTLSTLQLPPHAVTFILWFALREISFPSDWEDETMLLFLSTMYSVPEQHPAHIRSSVTVCYDDSVIEHER